MERIELLLLIAETGALFEKCEFTTGGLAKKLGVTQQTVSNELRRLENKGLIVRNPSYSGINIILTDEGNNYLYGYLKRLSDVFDKAIKLTGKVFTGLDEGKFYTELPGYKKQFIEKLGIQPFPGTLNLRVVPSERKRFLHGIKPVIVDGFTTPKRTFGDISCYPVKVSGLKAAITVPKRTIHKEDTVELICSDNLREKLKVNDSDEVTIEWE